MSSSSVPTATSAMPTSTLLPSVAAGGLLIVTASTKARKDCAVYEEKRNQVIIILPAMRPAGKVDCVLVRAC
jgi:hypothetical protein